MTKNKTEKAVEIEGTVKRRKLLSEVKRLRAVEHQQVASEQSKPKLGLSQELTSYIVAIEAYLKIENDNLFEETLKILRDLVVELDGEAKPHRIRAYWNELVRVFPEAADDLLADELIELYSDEEE